MTAGSPNRPSVEIARGYWGFEPVHTACTHGRLRVARSILAVRGPGHYPAPKSPAQGRYQIVSGVPNQGAREA